MDPCASLGAGMPSQMRPKLHGRRKVQALGRHAKSNGFGPQRTLGERIGPIEPKHGIGHGGQDFHPQRELPGGDFVAVIKTGEHERARTQGGEQGVSHAEQKLAEALPHDTRSG